MRLCPGHPRRHVGVRVHDLEVQLDQLGAVDLLELLELLAQVGFLRVRETEVEHLGVEHLDVHRELGSVDCLDHGLDS